MHIPPPGVVRNASNLTKGLVGQVGSEAPLTDLKSSVNWVAQAEACGFPEFNHFPLLVQYFQFFAQKLGWRYLGEIMRPAGDSLSDEQYQETFAWYYNLVRQAGEQLIRQGRIAPEVQTGLRQDLFPGGPEAFREEANRYWSETMAKFGLTGKPPGQAG